MCPDDISEGRMEDIRGATGGMILWPWCLWLRQLQVIWEWGLNFTPYLLWKTILTFPMAVGQMQPWHVHSSAEKRKQGINDTFTEWKSLAISDFPYALYTRHKESDVYREVEGFLEVLVWQKKFFFFVQLLNNFFMGQSLMCPHKLEWTYLFLSILTGLVMHIWSFLSIWENKSV